MKKNALLLIFFVGILVTSLLFSSCGHNCETCHDKLTVTCADCHGKGEKRCFQCGGDGFAPCALCNGMGSRTCYACGGTGGRMEYDFFSKMYVYKSCYSCVGGRVSCIMTTICSCGDGYSMCYTCGAQGRVDCPDCVPKGTEP